MMAEEFNEVEGTNEVEDINEVEGTSVSTLDMDPESRRLFNVRKVQKGKKPQFKRTCSHKFKRLDDNWRRPRGSQGKQRRKYVSKGALVQVGYGSPAAVKGLHPSGYSDVLISSIAELELVDPSYEAIRIAGTIGAQKKALIFAKAEEAGIKVLNSGRSE
jgi:large subunit ribosomal protein L32e